jgi:hypothetical protein
LRSPGKPLAKVRIALGRPESRRETDRRDSWRADRSASDLIARAERAPEREDLGPERAKLLRHPGTLRAIGIERPDLSPDEPAREEREECPAHDTRVRVGVPIVTDTAGSDLALLRAHQK